MNNNDELRRRAYEARTSYHKGLISREEAKKEIDPFIEKFNEKSKKAAKKYGLRPKYINFSSFVR